MQKKRHTGLIVLLVILLVILLIPAIIYGYLAVSAGSVEMQRCAYDPEETYQGAPTYRADGTVDVSLTEADVYWLLDHYDEVETLLADYSGMIKGYAVKLREGGLTLHVNGKLLGFLPVPLTVTTDMSCSKGVVDAVIREVRVGKRINIPLEKLAALGIPETFSFDLNDDDIFSKADTAEFHSDAIVISETFLEEFGQDAARAARKSCVGLALYTYEGEQALIGLPVLTPLLGPDPLENGASAEEDAMLAYLIGAPDPSDALATLLALCSEEQAQSLYDGCDAFEKHFLLDPLLEKAEARREEYLARAAAGQGVYEGLLNTLREQYKALQITLDRNAFLDTATGEPISLAALAPEAAIDAETSRIQILYSYDALHAVATADMPILADVPKTSKQVLSGGVSDKIPYDLGIILRMPCGVDAILYREATGAFVVNFLPASLADKLRAAKTLEPLLSDEIPRPPTRTLCDAPGAGCSPYVILYNPLAE